MSKEEITRDKAAKEVTEVINITYKEEIMTITNHITRNNLTKAKINMHIKIKKEQECNLKTIEEILIIVILSKEI
jgi:hypothetical protein